MGGLLVTAVVLGLTVCLTLILYRESGRSILLPMGTMALTTLLGWYDDRLTLVGRKSEGLRAQTKFAVLGIIALGASLVLWDTNGRGTDLVQLPAIKKPFETVFKAMDEGYRGLLGWALRHKLVVGLLAVGALIGAAAALLLAPKTGEETREILREKGTDWARQARERGSELAKRAQETMNDAHSRAHEYLGRGREVVEDTSAQLKAAFEAGRGAMREEIARLRGRDEPLEGV